MIPPSDIVHIVIVSDKFFDINPSGNGFGQSYFAYGKLVLWDIEYSNLKPFDSFDWYTWFVLLLNYGSWVVHFESCDMCIVDMLGCANFCVDFIFRRFGWSVRGILSLDRWHVH